MAQGHGHAGSPQSTPTFTRHMPFPWAGMSFIEYTASPKHRQEVSELQTLTHYITCHLKNSVISPAPTHDSSWRAYSALPLLFVPPMGADRVVPPPWAWHRDGSPHMRTWGRSQGTASRGQFKREGGRVSCCGTGEINNGAHTNQTWFSKDTQ